MPSRKLAQLALPALALMATTAATSPALAQRGAPAVTPVLTGDPARRDITVPDSVPNISGTWTPQTFFRTIRPMSGEETPFLPWAKKFFLDRSAAEAAGQPLFDPNANCLPSGVPRVLPTPYPYDIVQTPDAIYVGIEVMHSFRIIHMDGKPMPADFKPSYLGYSVGHWEGETLVIKTTGLNGFTQVDEEGRPKSSSMTVTERWTKKAPDLLENEFTLDDPKTYAHPWTALAEYKWAPNVRFNEYVCEENNRNKPDASGKLRHN